MKSIKEKFDEDGVRFEVLRFAAAMEMTLLYDNLAPKPVKDDEGESPSSFDEMVARAFALEEERERLRASFRCVELRRLEMRAALNAAVDELAPRPPSEVRADLEQLCEGNWMNVPHCTTLPPEIKAMVVKMRYLTITDEGHVRDDDEGPQTCADLWEKYKKLLREVCK